MKTTATPYIIADLKQGTPEWLAFRQSHITASQMPSLFDLSPYQTRLQLFEEKFHQILPKEDPYKEKLFARGHDAEEAARIWIKENLGIEMTPMVMVCRDFPILMASLDGFNEKENIIFEAKYMGAENLAKVRSGKIPAHHECQIQAQLRVSGAKKCIYFAMDSYGNAAHLDVFPIEDYMTDIVTAATKFMDMVASGTQPEPSERDFHVVEDERFATLCELKVKMDEAKEAFEEFKDFIDEFSEYTRIKAHGLMIVRSVRKGSINYSKIPQIKGIDLERYRGAPVTSVSVSLIKTKKKASA